MVRKFHNHKLQTNPWHCEEEPHSNHEALGKQTKQSNKISLPHLLALFFSLSLSLFSILSTRSPIYSLLPPLSLCVSLSTVYSILFVVLHSLFSLSLSTLSLSTSLSTPSPSLRLSLLSLSLSLLCLSTLSLSILYSLLALLYTLSILNSLLALLSTLFFSTRTSSLLTHLLYSLFLYSHSFSTRTPSLLALPLYSLLLYSHPISTRTP